MSRTLFAETKPADAVRHDGRSAHATELPEDTRRRLLADHGSFAIAYSVAMQPGLRHFGDERGFLGYTTVGKTAFVLGDPLAPRALWEPLIERFLDTARDAGFWQISRSLAEVLDRKGFFVNELGRVTKLGLEDFSFAGPQRRSFRTAANRVGASGSRVREMSLGDIDPASILAISNGWRSGKVTSRRELGFLVRPVILADEPGVRKFFLFDADGRPQAFAFFDPVYDAGHLTGYLSATRRWLSTADPLSAYALVGAAIQQFKAEGLADLHLGLSPFHKIRDGPFTKNWLIKRSFRFLYTNGLANRFIYPAQSLARHKESYGGTNERSYYAFNTLPALPRLLKLLRACRLI